MKMLGSNPGYLLKSFLLSIVSCSTGDTSPLDLCIMTLFEAGALVLAFPVSSWEKNGIQAKPKSCIKSSFLSSFSLQNARTEEPSRPPLLQGPHSEDLRGYCFITTFKTISSSIQLETSYKFLRNFAIAQWQIIFKNVRI